MDTVEVDGQPIAVKIARHGGAVVNAQPEYDDVARAAAALGRPVSDVLAAAIAATHALPGGSRLMDLAVVGLTFAAIFLVELPDKTFIATLVLSTKFRPLLVWIGVGLAFAVQTTVAVALGKVASLLPADVGAHRVAPCCS